MKWPIYGTALRFATSAYIQYASGLQSLRRTISEPFPARRRPPTPGHVSFYVADMTRQIEQVFRSD
jgi:hypothetical protein